MKINFTEEERKELESLIEEYHKCNAESANLKKQAEKLDKKIDELKEQEQTMMGMLTEKYGKFSLQDLYESLYM